METFRAFIALDIPPELGEVLGRLSGQLAHFVPARAVRWVQPTDMHLTLIFLGEGVTAVQMNQISQLLDQVTPETKPFTLHLDKLGCFPKPLAPRVIWAGLGGEVTAVRQLKSKLDNGLEPLGWSPERRHFSPHLTLGRVKDSSAVAHAGLPFDTPLASKSFLTTAVHLYQSELTRQGPLYKVWHTSVLG